MTKPTKQFIDMDGNTMTVEYIDPTHARIGNWVFHVEQVKHQSYYNGLVQWLHEVYRNGGKQLLCD